MRSSLTKALRARHDPDCRFGEGLINGRYVMICTPTCSLTALGDGDTHKSVDRFLEVEALVRRKVKNRRNRMIRKKRRGWL